MSEADIPALASAHTAPQSGGDALLTRLQDQGAERFDPAGWHYLKLLARHAAQHDESVARMLDAKLERSAAAFWERFERARSLARELLDIACAKHPHAAAELQKMFADSDFKSLRRMSATLDAREQCAGLTGLVSQLAPAMPRAAGPAPAKHAASRQVAVAVVSPPLELKTVRESRATWARLSVDRQLSQAMKQGPQNAGPINSHMLVLRSLSMMQDISPDYLSRIVSYVDTLLALDPGEKELPVKRKKAVPAKAAKATKASRK